jgi:hypothetical protein
MKPRSRCDLCGKLGAGRITAELEDAECQPMVLCGRHLHHLQMYLGAERYAAALEFKGGPRMKLVKNGNGGELPRIEELKRQWLAIEEPYLRRRAAAKVAQYQGRLAFVGKLLLERDRRMGAWPANPQERRKLRERETELQRQHLQVGLAARQDYIQATSDLVAALNKEAAEYDAHAMKYMEPYHAEIVLTAGWHAANLRLRATMLMNALVVEQREVETLQIATESWDGTRASDWWHEPETIRAARPYEVSMFIYPGRRTNLLTTSDEMLLQGVYGEQREQRRAHIEEARREQMEEQREEQQYRERERRRLDNLYRREGIAHSLGLGVKAEDIAALEEVGAA